MCNPITTASPDRLLAKGEHCGFQWEVTHNGLAFRCGYVRIPSGHAWHGKDWDEVDVEVHGGITFAEPDTECGKGGNDDAWWLGFDCAHGYDLRDPELPGYRDFPSFDPNAKVRSQLYVESECRKLCEQAAAVVQQLTLD